MRTALVETFQATMQECFVTVVETMLGPQVKVEVIGLLERSGIAPREIAARFDDVVNVLTDAFGSSARVLVYKTVVELYSEYSLRPTFGFYDSLRDQISFLKERVMDELLKPKHLLTHDHPNIPRQLEQG